jgi:biotin transport system substrate-specific component
MHTQSKYLTLVDTIVPVKPFRYSLLRDMALVLSFVIITTMFARITIPLPFTPVPITGQTFAVLLSGAVLGSRRGASAMAIYLIAGSWLPMYANGASGFVWGLGSGGYIIGFIPAAYVVGLLSEKGWDRKPWIILSMLIGSVLIYIPGLLQLSLFYPDANVFVIGLYPFILGDLIKIGLASIMLPSSWTILRLSKGSLNKWK